jgi:hypothetical protein
MTSAARSVAAGTATAARSDRDTAFKDPL